MSSRNEQHPGRHLRQLARDKTTPCGKMPLEEDEAIRRARALRRAGHTAVVAYSCEEAGHWHVGHRDQKSYCQACVTRRKVDP